MNGLRVSAVPDHDVNLERSDQQLHAFVVLCRDRVDTYLRRLVADSGIHHTLLREAAEYAVFSGGKRLRPVLALICGACGGSAERALHAAAGVELVHCFSLVHDDLPALDNDILRRGKPTVHVKFGEPLAILVGDLLLSLAHETIAADTNSAQLSRELAIATREMIDGQVIDTLGDAEPDAEPLASLERMHAKKTGALLTAAARMGAISAQASPDYLEAATSYARSIGLMFQIVDDLLDVECSTDELGKTAGKDEAMGKLTFPRLIGIDASRKRVDALLADAIRETTRLPCMQEELSDFAQMLATRTR